MMDIRPSEDDKKGGNHRRPSGHPFPLPQELVDLIIDTIDRSGCQHPREFTLATLSACSLIAKGWTTRAQRRMFQWAELYDTIGLHSFAETLRASPHLAGYVERLTLARPHTSSGYSPDPVEALFPTVLGGLLPNLRCLAFDVHSGMSSSGPQLAPEDRGVVDVASGTSQGPYLPIDPRFPLFPSPFSGLEELDLSFVVFQTFIDFARTLYAFEQIRTLRCGDVNWITLGISIPSFMETTNTPQSGDTFFPHLENLTVFMIARHGTERLLSGLARAASLRTLTVYLPSLFYANPSVDPATGRLTGLDLSPFPRLSEVRIEGIAPYLSRPTELSMLSVLRDLLASWDTPGAVPSFSLSIKPRPYSEQIAGTYTKATYLDFLAQVGKTVEEACTSRRGSTVPTLHVLLEMLLVESSTLEELGREAVQLFPMTSKLGRLTIEAYTSDDDHISWKSSIDVDDNL